MISGIGKCVEKRSYNRKKEASLIVPTYMLIVHALLLPSISTKHIHFLDNKSNLI
jgi:hypothetical protein